MKQKEPKKAELVRDLETNKRALAAQADLIAKLKEQAKRDAGSVELIAATSLSNYNLTLEQADTIDDLQAQLDKAEHEVAQLDLDKTRLLSTLDNMRVLSDSMVRGFTNVRERY